VSADVVPGADLSALRKVKARDYLVRFVFGALISFAAAAIGKAFGPRFGGMFLAFPAILPASLTLLEEKEGTRRADRNAIGAVLGATALLVFAGICEAGFTHLRAAWTLTLAFAGWLVTAVTLYAVLALFRPQDCDRNRD
jgi:4-hydroxybenzoate polyprenyltransferase